MGHLSANPAGPNSSGEGPVRREPPSKGHHWVWILALAVLVGLGIWHFRGPRSNTEAQGPAAPGGASKGQGRQGAGAGGFGGPGAAAPAQRGDLPAHSDGLGAAPAVNTSAGHTPGAWKIPKTNAHEG